MEGPALFGNDLFGEPIKQASRGKLADEFLVPPFSVLNAREGWWQQRKAAWLALGIRSELGRGGGINNVSTGCLELSGGWENNPAHKAQFDGAIDTARKASPGGNMMPAMKQRKDGITTRGDGAGNDIGVIRKNDG